MNTNKRIVVLFMLLLIIYSFFLFPASAQENPKQEKSQSAETASTAEDVLNTEELEQIYDPENYENEYKPGEVIVGLKSELDTGSKPKANTFSMLGPAEQEELFDDVEIDDIDDLTVNPGGNDTPRTTLLLTLEEEDEQGVLDAIKALKENPNVAYAEPNYAIYLEKTPNDTLYSKYQWDMPKIKTTNAWDITTGSSSIKVGVIDTGIDDSHMDLKNNVNKSLGHNFVNGNNNTTDSLGHGTYVSGIIGAVGNNSNGIAGMCWNITLVPLKIFNTSSVTYQSYSIKAIQHATSKGLHMINASYSSDTYSQAEYDAIKSFKGVFVAAAGNQSSSTKRYPAAYDCGNIISVASSTSGDKLSSFSNYSKEWIDLAAPGTDITSTMPDNKYGTGSGTSIAAPHVTGAAALIKALYPNLSADQIKSAILDGVDKVSGLSGKTATGGRLNIKKAQDNVKKVKSLSTGYYTSNPGYIVLTSKLNVYKDTAFKNKTGKSYAKGTVLKTSGISYSSGGTPRLKVSGGYISSNRAYSCKYYTFNPGYIVLTSKLNVYKDTAFKNKTGKSYAKGCVVKVTGIAYSSEGIPRLKISGGYISSNSQYSSKYHQTNPGSIVLASKLNVYKDTNFKKKTGKSYAKGSVVKVTGISYSSGGIPRLKISGGYISANSQYSSKYHRSNPGYVVLKSKLNVYKDVNLTKKTGKSYAKGSVVKVTGFSYSSGGIPRLKVSGGYVSAKAQYSGIFYQTKPKKVKLKSNLNVYRSPNFSNSTKTGKKFKKGATVTITGITNSSGGTPRLKVSGGYISAAAKYFS